MRLIDAVALERIIQMERCAIINGILAVQDRETGTYKPLLDEIKTAFDINDVHQKFKEVKQKVCDWNACNKNCENCMFGVLDEYFSEIMH